MKAGNLVVAVFVPPRNHGEEAEQAPAAAESFVEGAFLEKGDGGMEFLYLLAALYAPLKGRFLRIHGIVALLLADEEGRHDLDEHGSIGKGLGEHGEETAHLLFAEVHGSAFQKDEDGTTFVLDFFEPAGIEDGGGEIVNALLLFFEQALAQFHDIGQVEVVPVDLSVVDAVEAGVETAGEIDAYRIGMLFDECLRFMVEDVTAHGDPRLRVLGAGELGEVVVDLLDEPHGEIVSDQAVRTLRFFCSRPQGDEQGFRHTAELCFHESPPYE